MLAVPPVAGGRPSVSLSETPCALGSYQLSFELNNATVTFQGTLESLTAHVEAAHTMLSDFQTPPAPRGRLFAGYQKQARTDTRGWNGR